MSPRSSAPIGGSIGLRFRDERELVPAAMDLPYTHLTEADYDTKLREIGNYLWELEQELLTADAAQDEAKALQVHEKISRLTAKADQFFKAPGEPRLLASYVSELGLRFIAQLADPRERFS